MFCKRCGKILADNAKFCKFCGIEHDINVEQSNENNLSGNESNLDNNILHEINKKLTAKKIVKGIPRNCTVSMAPIK